MIRRLLHKILGLNKVITQLSDRVTLIENIVGINNFMSIGEGNIGSGNVGVGNVGVGSTAPDGNVGDGNVGVGSTAPTTETQSLCPPDDGNVGSGNVGSGNVGIGSA